MAHRLSPQAESWLRQHGEKITVVNMGSNEPDDLEEMDVDEGKDGHLWIPGQRRPSRIIIPLMAGYGEVKAHG